MMKCFEYILYISVYPMLKKKGKKKNQKSTPTDANTITHISHDHTHPFGPDQAERGWQTFLTAIATRTS